MSGLSHQFVQLQNLSDILANCTLDGSTTMYEDFNDTEQPVLKNCVNKGNMLLFAPKTSTAALD